MVEIGIYSGGSLPMWREYFGEGSSITGIDIEPACKTYEREGIRVEVGDQADRGFWRRFREEYPPVDVLIDDGGHTPEQQQVTLEEMLPHLRPGGVFICEDIHGAENPFAGYVHALARGLNAFPEGVTLNEITEGFGRTAFQEGVFGVHLYPYVTVIERAEGPAGPLAAPKRGTEWQPFFDRGPAGG